VELDNEQTSHDQIPPEPALMEIAQYAEKDEDTAGSEVISCSLLDAAEHIVV
jgi:hypothetical protein